MSKIFRRFSAVALAGLMATCMAVTASAAKNTYKCPNCGKTTTSTLEVTSTSAVATTSIDDGSRGVSVSIYGEYLEKDTMKPKNIGNGNSYTAGVTASISNGGGTWTKVKSTHSKCCSGSSTTLNW